MTFEKIFLTGKQNLQLVRFFAARAYQKACGLVTARCNWFLRFGLERRGYLRHLQRSTYHLLRCDISKSSGMLCGEGLITNDQHNNCARSRSIIRTSSLQITERCLQKDFICLFKSFSQSFLRVPREIRTFYHLCIHHKQSVLHCLTKLITY